MNITDRVRIRNAAREACEYVDLDAYTREQKIHFAKCIRDLCNLDDAPPSVTGPMTDDEAREWGKQGMPFGKHVGQAVNDTPIEYLVWIADTGGKFQRDLNRYLKSPRLRREIESEATP